MKISPIKRPKPTEKGGSDVSYYPKKGCFPTHFKSSARTNIWPAGGSSASQMKRIQHLSKIQQPPTHPLVILIKFSRDKTKPACWEKKYSKNAVQLQSEMWALIHMCKRSRMMGDRGSPRGKQIWEDEMQMEPTSHDLRYAHTAFQTLITAGQVKCRIKASESQTLMKLHPEWKVEGS